MELLNPEILLLAGIIALGVFFPEQQFILFIAYSIFTSLRYCGFVLGVFRQLMRVLNIGF